VKSSFDFDERYRARMGGYRDLMRHQVRNILFVSSLYESFIMAEDGHLHEVVLSKFLDLNIRMVPDLRRVPSGRAALELIDARERRFDLIITSPELRDMDALELLRRIRGTGVGIPVVLLAYDQRELEPFRRGDAAADIERVFLWQGDPRILLAIVKTVEDRLNADADTGLGVPVFLVVEDNVRYYSSFLPVIYTEVMNLSQAVISEGGNLLQRLMRMRARPKILLATSYEEAWDYFTRYRANVHGVISDIEFPRGGEMRADAGIELARAIRDQRGDVPIALQSSNPDKAALARRLDAGFLQKGSPEMLRQLRTYLLEHLFFGDFVFRDAEGREIDRSADLRGLVETLRTVPPSSLAHHAGRNDFSRWLQARAEFGLAEALRPRRISDFDSIEHLRRELIDTIDGYRRERNRSTVATFESSTFDPREGMAQIGGGSLGGKGRGLAFAQRLLDEVKMDRRFAKVRIRVPPAVILGTGIFEQFLEDNGLRSASIQSEDDFEMHERILDAPLTGEVVEQLAAYLDRVDAPLAVRSSSLLEDSPYQPFSGIYETVLLPNDHPDRDIRLAQLVRAVKGVYASTFAERARAFFRTTPYRLEEERMAVIVQKVVGRRRNGYFYPDISGVARSHNYYPVEPVRTEDGIAAVALGLGRTVATGEPCLRFSPSHPRHLLEFSTVEDMVENSQREFWALHMTDPDEPSRRPHDVLERLPLRQAEEDGVLRWVGSTYSPENDAIYDGIARDGVRLVSFAPILKQDAFPLAQILQEFLIVCRAGTRSPVEIEFAANLPTHPDEPAEVAFLQLRPLAVSREHADVNVEDEDPTSLICHSPSVLGNGRLDEIHDVVVVDRERFDRERSREAAEVVARFNDRLVAEERPYVLVGVGRWGSTHSWLGIPVAWEDIAGAAVIVEAGFRDFRVTPSQGTHFFQNLASRSVGYFTVNEEAGEGFVDWSWMAERPEVASASGVRHLRFEEPVVVKMNGKERRGVIRKPGEGDGA